MRTGGGKRRNIAPAVRAGNDRHGADCSAPAEESSTTEAPEITEVTKLLCDLCVSVVRFQSLRRIRRRRAVARIRSRARGCVLRSKDRTSAARPVGGVTRPPRLVAVAVAGHPRLPLDGLVDNPLPFLIDLRSVEGSPPGLHLGRQHVERDDVRLRHHLPSVRSASGKQKKGEAKDRAVLHEDRV